MNSNKQHLPSITTKSYGGERNEIQSPFEYRNILEKINDMLSMISIEYSRVDEVSEAGGSKY